jgi:hypothetical protein
MLLITQGILAQEDKNLFFIAPVCIYVCVFVYTMKYSMSEYISWVAHYLKIDKVKLLQAAYHNPLWLIGLNAPTVKNTFQNIK